MSRRLKITGALLVIAVCTLVLMFKLLLPEILKKKILDGAKEACPDCTVYFKTVSMSLAHPGVFEFFDVRFVQGDAGHALVEARLKSLIVDIALTESSREKVVINRIEGGEAEVIYAEGDDPEVKKPDSGSSGKTYFEIRHTKLTSALFRYVHTKRKKSSILHIHNIDGEMSEVGNTPEALDKMATARLTGQIEKSGHCTLDIAALLRPGPWYVDIALELTDQNLADANTFFTPDEGVELKGLMIKAVAKLNVRDETTKAHVEAVYKDADFKEEKTKDRTGVEAALSNLGSALLMRKSNVDLPPEKQKSDIEVKHDPGEALVHYLLRSTKLGLIDLAKKI